MKAKLRYLVRFLRLGPRLTSFDLRIDPESTLESTSRTIPQTGPEMPSDPDIPDLRNPMPEIRAYSVFY